MVESTRVMLWKKRKKTKLGQDDYEAGVRDDLLRNLKIEYL